MDRLPKVEGSLLSLVRHMEVGVLKLVSPLPTPMKSTPKELFLEFEASRSGKSKVGEGEETLINGGYTN